MKLGIDLSEANVSDAGFNSIPAGDYTAGLVDAVYKDTNAGDGKCLHLKFLISEGEFSGRQLMSYLTLEHPNEKTVRIAKARLKQLASAVGHPNPDHVEDTDELVGPVILQVIQQKSDDFGMADGFKNEIKSFKSKDESPTNSEPVPF